MKQTFIGKNRR